MNPIPVHRRCVLYVSGFDPKGAAHYHGLFQEEGPKQTPHNGLRLDVGPRQRLKNGDSRWRVRAASSGTEVQTTVEFLHWDDVVRAHWTRATPRLWWQIVSTTLFNLRHGALWRMYRLSWPPALALFLPFVLVCAMVLGGPLLGGLSAWAMANLGAGTGWVLAAGLLASGAWAGLGWVLQARYSMHWMMRSYAFNALQAQGLTPDLEQRLDAHAQTLVDRVMAAEHDEVLLVGHSSGANMAASVLARACRLNPAVAQQTTVLSFLTLGQWIPSLGTLPMAHAYRRDLETLASANGVHWVDFSAPSDACCFALQNPLLACGVAPAAPGISVQVINPKFADMFAPTDYAALKKDRLSLHFQYLKASPRPVLFDYFSIVAGPLTLEQRFKNQGDASHYNALRGPIWSLWGSHTGV